MGDQAGLLGLVPLAALVLGAVGFRATPSGKPQRQARFIQLTLLLLAVLAGLGIEELARRDAPISGGVLGEWGRLYFDSLTAVMVLLISFLGIVITRFSVRYLDGHSRQVPFFRYLALTLASVLLLVMAGDLLTLLLAWIATSSALHLLLTLQPHRREAIIAARTKFIISRLGDLMLIAALVMTYRAFGTFDYRELFQAAVQPNATTAFWLPWIGAAVVFGAATKSAQFPFHSWLPNTMETPTPVSALMHAGIINAGGFLIIRLSPLLVHAPIALESLALLGAFTALFGALVASTQTSVKRALAYSTVAQMGFMMLQCGLGAFSAALLHIVAHSAYKAHAFLSCGSVLEAADGQRLAPAPAPPRSKVIFAQFAGVVLAALLLATFGYLTGLIDLQKPGGWLLISIMGLAIAQLLSTTLIERQSELTTRLAFWSLAVIVGYTVAYSLIDQVLKSSVSHFDEPLSTRRIIVMAIVGLAFFATYVFLTATKLYGQSRFIRSLYVHLSAGFYIDWFWRRVGTRVSRLSPSSNSL